MSNIVFLNISVCIAYIGLYYQHLEIDIVQLLIFVLYLLFIYHAHTVD